jgi:hypothetical protein
MTNNNEIKIIEKAIEQMKEAEKSPAAKLADQIIDMPNIDLVHRIATKTIAFDMGPGVKAMSDEESWEWHKKHARINEDGTMTISEDEIGDGSYEKKHKKPCKRNI